MLPSVTKTSLKKMWNNDSLVLKVSLKLTDQNRRTNSLTSLEPR